MSAVTNERAFLQTVFPQAGFGDSIFLYYFDTGHAVFPVMLAAMASHVFDFAVRQKMGGLNLSSCLVEQLPVVSPPPARTCDLFVRPRLVELIYTAWDLEPFARDCGYDGSPFIWDEERRFLIRCELDAAFFHLYLPRTPDGQWKPARKADGAVVDETPEQLAELKRYFPTPRHAVEYIMETFPIVKRKDIEKYGSYRTKETILEIYDQMQAAMAAASGQQRVASGEHTPSAAAGDSPLATGHSPLATYHSPLSPPPGPPCDEQGNFIPMRKWDPANWPPHIHRPKEAVVEVIEQVPIADFAAMTYPATDADKAICAVALAVVEQRGSISSMEHLDAVLLATCRDWCKAFLDEADQRALNTAIRSAPPEVFVGRNQLIRWKECRDYLEKRSAITVAHGSKDQPITVGTALRSVKLGLPTGADGVVKYAIKALERIRELRKDLSSVPQAQRLILDAFEEQHRLYHVGT